MRQVGRLRQRAAQTGALLSMLWRAGRWLAVAFGLLTVVHALLPIAVVLFTGVLVGAIPGVVENGMGSSDGYRAMWLLSAIALTFLASGLGEAIAGYAAPALATRYTIEVHDATAAAAAGPPDIAELERPDIAGELEAVREYDRAGIYAGAVWHLQDLVRQRIQGIAVFVILLGFAWWAALIVLAGWRLVNWAAVRWINTAVELGHAHSGTGLRQARYWRNLAVEPPAAKEIRVFGLAEWIVGRYAQAWLGTMSELWRDRRASWPRLLVAVGGLVTALGVVLAAIGAASFRGELSIAALVIFVQAVVASDSQGPGGYAQWAVGRVRQSAHKVVELEARLAAGSRSSVAATCHASATGPMAVRFEGVRFRYRGRSEPTLDQLDLAIPAGQSIAVVGENGAGKTTLIKLLCGLYTPDAGRISLNDGTDPVAARSRIAAIFQNFVRYELTLRDNVGFGCLKLTDNLKALDGALHDAGARDLSDTLPAGWDTVLSRAYENGADLSGGQWQQVAVARALTAVRGGAGLLILDEPTANLNVRAEVELFERFLAVTKGVTTILVSHRLSGVRRADRIVVLDQGRVVEDGTHDELIAAGGRYAAMYAQQAERFAVTGPSGHPAAEGVGRGGAGHA